MPDTDALAAAKPHDHPDVGADPGSVAFRDGCVAVRLTDGSLDYTFCTDHTTHVYADTESRPAAGFDD